MSAVNLTSLGLLIAGKKSGKQFKLKINQGFEQTDFNQRAMTGFFSGYNGSQDALNQLSSG